MNTRALFPVVIRLFAVFGLAALLLSSSIAPPMGAQASYTIKSLACDNWMYDPGNEDQIWLITVGLTVPASADFKVQLTTDRPDIVVWTTIYAAPSDGRVSILQGQSEGSLFLRSDFQPVETTVTVSAQDQVKTWTCKAVIPKKVNTPTPVVTPNLTPTVTPTPLPPPKLSTMRMQTGSRSGNPSGIRICLDRDAPDNQASVALTSDHPAIFPVPAFIGIARDARCVSFNVLVRETRTAVPVSVTATFGARSLTGTTMVRPARPAIYTQTASRSLGQSKVTVCVQSTAGANVPLTSSRPDIFPVPPAVTIPAGKACQSIVVAVGYVDSDTSVTVGAAFDSGPKTGTTVVKNFGVLPPATATNLPTSTPLPTPTETLAPTATATEPPTATVGI
jgi:hypothetical protein